LYVLYSFVFPQIFETEIHQINISKTNFPPKEHTVSFHYKDHSVKTVLNNNRYLL